MCYTPVDSDGMQPVSKKRKTKAPKAKAQAKLRGRKAGKLAGIMRMPLDIFAEVRSHRFCGPHPRLSISHLLAIHRSQCYSRLWTSFTSHEPAKLSEPSS